MKSRPRGRRAFTLIELLVVIAVIGVVIAMLIPAVQKVRESAARTKCMNNEKQLALGCHRYHDLYKHFPPGGKYGKTTGNSSVDCHYAQGNWLVYTLPFMEQDSLYAKLHPLLRYVNASNPSDPKNDSIQTAVKAGILPVPLPYGRCPSDPFDPKASVCNYVASMGPQCMTGGPYDKYCDGRTFKPPLNYKRSPAIGSTLKASQIRGMFNRRGDKIAMRNVTDGTSNTILFGETLAGEQGVQTSFPARFGGMYHVRNWAVTEGGNTHGTTIIPINTKTPCPGGPCDDINLSFGYKSNHARGANFAFADGSVHYLFQGIDHRSYQALGCRNDGASVPLPE